MRPRLALAALLCLGTAALWASPHARPVHGADGDPLDYRFYKARIAPILHAQCGECHADPRKRTKVGRLFLSPAPGRTIRERFHERNFERVLELVEPNDPSASLLLLKAIGPRNGGVTHEGGELIGTNTPEYGALIDWINGTKQPEPTFKAPATEEGAPDFLFFYKRIEPVLLGVCAECHGGRGKGRMKLITHERGEEFPLEDHFTNYETVLKLIRPGEPLKSRFFTKPLALADGGIKHQGGDQILKDSANYENWTLFIQGERGPPLPVEGERIVPTLTAEGLAIQAEDFAFEGSVEDVEMKGAEEFYVANPGETGGRIVTPIRVVDAGPYTVHVRLQPGTRPVTLSIGGVGTWTPALPTERDEHGFGVVSPTTLLDGREPLVDPRGGLDLRGSVLHMDGRQEAAAWLSPSTARNAGALARIRPAHEEEGGDDALLLFDMDDGWNGKFVGLNDGGRRFVMGVVEGGALRVLTASKAPEPHPDRREAPREVKVEYFGGVAIGSLDGKPLLVLNLSGNLGRGQFGVLTHGLAEVHHVAAVEEYEVYEVSLRTGPVVFLPAGQTLLSIDLPPGAGAVDEVRLRPPGN
ncbi:MAG: hypothetical protein O2894_11730 [Planctomycetota bacterium]|nr:hypothetical protein [Planctomycetota bacterium]